MRCIYCNTQLGNEMYCPRCGADLSLPRRIVRISNLLYNKGLEKASVRDLSGAIACLQQSLKFNKENTDARNLLGLCYYETGEAVSALCEWVISKNIKSGDNLAEEYIDRLQNDRNQLDAINQSIRKYNQSVEYCRQNHEDMAVMQLKKVVAQNPKLVKAQQLLALLYMKRQEYEKARRLLKKSLAIDNTNTTSLRFLTHVEETTGRTGAFSPRSRQPREDETIREEGGTLRYNSGNETIIQPTTFRDSSTIATFINIGLGILLGGAIIWFLAIPASRQSVQEKANREVTDANLKLATGNAQLQDLQDQLDGYQKSAEKAKQDKKDTLARLDSYNELFSAAQLYVRGDQTAAVDTLDKIRPEDLDGGAKDLYDSLMNGVSDTMFNQYYNTGTTAYVAQNYSTAAEQLKLAVESDPNGEQSNYYNALMYLGFAYFYLGDSTNADKYFNELIEKYPNQASTVQPYLSENAGSWWYSGQSGGQSAGQSQGEASLGNGQQSGGAGTAPAADASQTGNAGTGDAGQTWDAGTGDAGQTWDAQAGNTDNTQTWDSGTGYGQQPAYDPSQVAWTDPTTGLHYDAYGNLLG